MSRQSMSPAERELRSQLTRLLHEQPIVRGTLTVRKITCGNPNCRCAQGFTHDTLYLSYGRDAKIRQVSIPKELEAAVRQWVSNYHQVLAMLEGLCDFSQQTIKAHKSGGR